MINFEKHVTVAYFKIHCNLFNAELSQVLNYLQLWFIAVHC